MNKYQEALEAVYKDLLMRASFNTFHNDGELIVELGAGCWFKVCNALGKNSDERTREDIEEGRELLTINLSAKDKAVLEALAAKQELSLSRLLSQALATYQLYEAGTLQPINTPPEKPDQDEWFASLPQELRDSVNILDLRAIKPTSTSEEVDTPSDDWELEQKAFYFANNPDIPEEARLFVQEIWKVFCVSTSLEDAATIAATLWSKMAGTQSQHREREDYGKAVALAIRQIMKNAYSSSATTIELANRLSWCAEAPSGEEFVRRKACLTRYDIRQARLAVQAIDKQKTPQ